MKCPACGLDKPEADFPRSPAYASGLDERNCKDCKARRMRAWRAGVPSDVKADQQAAWRAGLRKDKCAICAKPIGGLGICEDCADHVEALGGLEGLKQAVRAVRYLTKE